MRHIQLFNSNSGESKFFFNENLNSCQLNLNPYFGNLICIPFEYTRTLAKHISYKHNLIQSYTNYIKCAIFKKAQH